MSPEGLALNSELFNAKIPVDGYRNALGTPSQTIEAGGPAPAGHRNNQVHVFDDVGVYLTEHHATQLIESVNFVLDASESLFPLDQAFNGSLTVLDMALDAKTKEEELSSLFQRDLPGDYSVAAGKCWVSINAVGRRTPSGKRSKPRYVVSVSVCF